jgi:hypothetical protein
MRKLGTDVAVMIERDDNIPPLADLLDELDVARSIARTEARHGPDRDQAERDRAGRDASRFQPVAGRSGRKRGRAPAAADRRGLSVYQNNYRAQLMDCLEASYPQTLALIGADAFRSAAAHHVDAVPPHSWTLDEYAEGLPGTLAALFPDQPETADLARLELALAEAFVAPDAPALSLADIPDVAWDTATLRLVPSATFLALSTNAADIWAALNREEAPPAADHGGGVRALILWRHDFTCCFQLMDAQESGPAAPPRHQLFETMCEELVGAGADHGLALAGELLARWSQAGLLRHPDR